MTRKIALLFALIFVCLPSIAAAPEQLVPSGWVNDYAGMIDAGTEGRINSLVDELKSKTGAEIAVVTIGSLEGIPLEEYASRLFAKWGIGEKGRDNGLLILVARDERRIKIETGYGIEGIIPDGRAGTIIREEMYPHFAGGDPSAGIYAGVYAAALAIADDKGVSLTGSAPEKAAMQQLRMTTGEKIILVIFLLIFIPLVIKNPWILLLMLRGGRGGYGGGGFSGGGFGGFGGGSSGGGGASGGW